MLFPKPGESIMRKLLSSLGPVALLVTASLLMMEPALAGHRYDYRPVRHHGNHHRQCYGYGFYAGARVQARSHHGHKYYGNGHHGYGHDQGYYYSGYQSGHHGHHHHSHQYGIVYLSGPAYGYSHCEVHGGYYRDGDIYY